VADVKVRKCDKCGAFITVERRNVKIIIDFDRSFCEDCVRWILEVVGGG
jgi:RNase P subunit RPR2